LVKYTEAITGRDGRAYVASARGGVGGDGLWHGWIDFTDGVRTVSTPQESEQPNRDDLMYWAQGLTHVYLEGALERALRPSGQVVAGGSGLSVEPNVRPVAVIDPYAVYRQGEDVLRGQLLALSRDQLNAVVEQYDLGVPVPQGSRGLLGYADAVDRIIVRLRASMAPSVPTRPSDSEFR
jgi:hypothetical protein